MKEPIKSTHVVIMAGGIGSRFWPLSTDRLPKQFIDILGCGKTMIQLTFERFRDLVTPDHIWVVTASSYNQIVREQLPEIPESNILLEPERKNTAPCIAYAYRKIKAKFENAYLVVTPADALIIDTFTFHNVVQKALSFLYTNSESLITVGVTPSRPEVGYGYIAVANKDSQPFDITKVQMFKEKPDLQTAEKYLRSGNYLWNAGILITSIDALERSYIRYLPKMTNLMDSFQVYFDSPLEEWACKRFFSQTESISIDYGVLENAESVYVIHANFGWSDLGTWESLHCNSSSDRFANASIGDHINIHNSSHNLVYAPELDKVVVNGLNGFIVAYSHNKLLICPFKDEQQIGNLIK